MAGVIAQWVITILTAVSLVVAIIKGSNYVKRVQESRPNHGEEFGALVNEVQNIKGTLDHPDYGLHALHSELGGMKTHCEGMTATFSNQIMALQQKKKR